MFRHPDWPCGIHVHSIGWVEPSWLPFDEELYSSAWNTFILEISTGLGILTLTHL